MLCFDEKSSISCVSFSPPMPLPATNFLPMINGNHRQTSIKTKQDFTHISLQSNDNLVVPSASTKPKPKMRSAVAVFPFLFFLLSGLVQESVHGRVLPQSTPRPSPDAAAAFARWLVSQNSWGVLSTLATDSGGAPFGNVVSFSDGLPDKGLGVPYFYLTTLDPTARYGLKDPRVSLTLSEYSLGTCGNNDPESPLCSKINLTGKFKLVDGKSKEADFARVALFTKHPEMKGWPKDHNFEIYTLEIEDIFLINFFGGPKPLTVDQYLKWKSS